jgi:hypothetical protein
MRGILQNDRTRQDGKTAGAGLQQNGRGFITTRLLHRPAEFHSNRAKIYIARDAHASKLNELITASERLLKGR